ncbi:MAG: hypothetical protein EOP85_01890 [Verrucomicrobiaceae bacterium]|nr:MAG: hypothetical protein EOP85_01890 [Verrucomicrobiaceae bacterium]
MLCLLLVLGAQFSSGEEPAPDKPTKEAHAETGEEPIVTDPAGKPYFPKGRDSYYATHYRAANLPSMQSMQVEKGVVRFRVGFFPSFSRPLFLSYARDTDHGVISVARLTGRLVLGEEPGTIEIQGAVRVKPEYSVGFEKRANRPEVREPLKALDERILPLCQAADGEEWILEVVTSDGYTMAVIRNPRDFKFLHNEFRSHFEKDIRKDPQQHGLPESFKKYEFPELDVSEFTTFCGELLQAVDMSIPSGERDRLPTYRIE